MLFCGSAFQIDIILRVAINVILLITMKRMVPTYIYIFWSCTSLFYYNGLGGCFEVLPTLRKT